MAEDNDEIAKKMLTINSEHRIRSENLPFDIDVWYPRLQNFTFRTIFYPFTREEAQAILRYHNSSWRGIFELTIEDVKTLRELERTIDTLINKKFKKTGAFLRLCGRSTKDGEPLERSWVLPRYYDELEHLKQQGYPENGNTMLIATSKVQYLKVCSGAEAMSLLLTSERVFTDLHDWLKYGEPEQLVLREWDPEMSYDFEFRGFVFNDSLNAISQYDHYCVYPYLKNMKEEIRKAITFCWREVHDHVAETSYVIDFAYYPESNTAKVIEISPFLTCTGPALFSWKEDRTILEAGPFEFRIKEDETSQIEDLVDVNWVMRWEQTVPKYWELYDQVSNERCSFFGCFFDHFLDFGFLKKWCSNSDSGLDLDKSKPMLLFVYGTLKKGFHWNQKFLMHCSYLGSAETVDSFPLVVGSSGVPYLLDGLVGKGQQVCGELWRVTPSALQNLDEYEGISKGHYCRRQIAVIFSPSFPFSTQKSVMAEVYFKTHVSEELVNADYHREYSLQYHLDHYSAIRHIQVKQQVYLGTANKDTFQKFG